MVLKLNSVDDFIRIIIVKKMDFEEFLNYFLGSKSGKLPAMLFRKRTEFHIPDLYVFFNQIGENTIKFYGQETNPQFTGAEMLRMANEVPFSIQAETLTVEDATTTVIPSMAVILSISRSHCVKLTLNSLTCSPQSLDQLIRVAHISKLSIVQQIEPEFVYHLNLQQVNSIEFNCPFDNWDLLNMKFANMYLTNTVVNNEGIQLLLKEWCENIRDIDWIHIHTKHRIDVECLNWIPHVLISKIRQEETYEIEKYGSKKKVIFYGISNIYIK